MHRIGLDPGLRKMCHHQIAIVTCVKKQTLYTGFKEKLHETNFCSRMCILHDIACFFSANIRIAKHPGERP
jgi:hypothetical protein